MKDFLNLSFRDIMLRDLIREDIESYIRWHIYETEWQNWDAPWEEVEKDIDKLRGKIEGILKQEKPAIRKRLQLCLRNGRHIGLVSYYLMEGELNKIAVGIDIAEKEYWGKGLGEQALKLWMAYLFNVSQTNDIYTETWSGNLRMVGLAEKLGFSEIRRERDKREVGGKMYDGMVFLLKKDKFIMENKSLIEYISRQTE